MNPKYNAVAGRLAKGLEPYVNIYRLPLEIKPVSIQKQELEGQIPFGQDLYHNSYFEQLVSELKEQNNSYL